MRTWTGTAIRAAGAAALLGAVAFYAACATTPNLPVRHLAAVSDRPVCSDCHEGWQADYDHTPSFAVRHGAAAARARELCGSCHSQAFCADCHAYRDEVAPALKNAGAPERLVPHQRSYGLQHRIDGRLDPASCFRCHGRRNEARCTPCHR